MTIGISKERLIELLKQPATRRNDELSFYLRYLINNECTELDPWLPFSEIPKEEGMFLVYMPEEKIRKMQDYNKHIDVIGG